jgi:hypothetical protein
MKYYEAQALLAIASGALLHLTDAQAAARKVALKPLADKPGHFEAVAACSSRRARCSAAPRFPTSSTRLELKLDTRDFDARIRKDRAAIADFREKQLAERKRRAEAIAAGEKRKAEERRRATEAKTRASADART